MTPRAKRPGPLEERLGPFGRIAGAFTEPIYRAVLDHRNSSFDQGKGVVTLDRPVISVGNLSVGGTGKTPMVQWIVRTLQQAGHHPAIAMRGYRAKPGQPSDEQAVYHQSLPGVPVVAQPNRTDGLIDLFATEEGERVDVVVLDDGFQHRRLARSYDLVLIDATRSPFEDRCLPAGWLREPPQSLTRASAIVLTHTDAASAAEIAELSEQISQVTGSPPVAEARHVWDSISIEEASGARTINADELLAPVFAVCGIGRPAGFLASCARHSGQNLAGSMVLTDHAEYTAALVERIVRTARDANAAVIAMTPKDWVKAKRVLDPWPIPVAIPELTLRLERGEDLRGQILAAATRVPDDSPAASASDNSGVVH